MNAPNFLVAELKTDSGQMLAILSAMPKQYSTGSQGFYANQKIEIGGKRYQVQLQLAARERGARMLAQLLSGGVATPAALRPLMQFAVVPGLHAFGPFPGGFANGSAYATLLPGAALKVEYERCVFVLRRAGCPACRPVRLRHRPAR